MLVQPRFSYSNTSKLKNWSIAFILYWILVMLFSTSPINVKNLSGTGSTFSANHLQPELMAQVANQQAGQIIDVIVQKIPDATGVEAAVEATGSKITRDLHIINAFVAAVPASKVEELNNISGIKWVSLDSPVVKTSSAGFTVCTNRCGNVNTMTNNYGWEVNAPSVWFDPQGGDWLQGQGVGVAVVDSGVANTFDISNRLVTSVLFNSNSTNVHDTYGHGSHVAGIIAGDGTISNGKYIGIAPKSNIISVKVSDDTGKSSASDVVSGLQWINDNKNVYNIRVVNMSVNSSVLQSYNVDPIDAAAEILWFNGVVVVTSAGNSGTANLYPPANDPFVLTVGAVDDKSSISTKDDSVATFSAHGVDELGNIKPDLVAPGTNIISLLAGSSTMWSRNYNNNLIGQKPYYYFMASGTSMAAPIVAGAAALLLQSEPSLNPDQVKYRLKATAMQSTPRWIGDTRAWINYDPTKAGAGYLDIQAAITQKSINGTANTGQAASHMLWSGNTPVTWSSVNWSSVNWSSVNWSSVNWSSVNWSSVNWSSDYWGNYVP